MRIGTGRRVRDMPPQRGSLPDVTLDLLDEVFPAQCPDPGSFFALRGGVQADHARMVSHEFDVVRPCSLLGFP